MEFPIQIPEEHRVRGLPGDFNGQYLIPFSRKVWIFCQASNGAGWEHVSVSVRTKNRAGNWEQIKRVPSWEEMCFVKDLFWQPEAWVTQFHPARSEYVNTHLYVLHLWKPTGETFPTPPAILVGLPGKTLKV